MAKKPIEETKSLILPVKELAKSQIEEQMNQQLNNLLEITTPSNLFVMLKQMEYAIKHALSVMQKPAIAQCIELGALKLDQFVIAGAKVEIKEPTEYEFSPAIDELKAKQKMEMDIAKKTEIVNGAAKKIQGEATIKVTLKHGD